MAEPWELKDTLRQMTVKFNNLVNELNDLKSSSDEINQSTQETLDSIRAQIETITNDLISKVESYETNSQKLLAAQGDLQKLQTNSKDSLVDAINELLQLFNKTDTEV